MKLVNTLLASTLSSITTLASPAPAPAAGAATFNDPAPYDFISLTAAGKIAPDSLTDGTSSDLSKRNLGGVRMSDGANFTGHVWYGIYPLNTCVDLRD